MVMDRYTGWIGAYPARTKSAEEVAISFQYFFGNESSMVQRVYTDGSLEFKKALQDLKISHDVSLPYNPSTNGVAENSIRRLKEGTRCTLIQSGLSPQWWAEAARAFVNYRNVTDLFNGQTLYFRSHGENYTGPIIPFGAAIRYLPNGPNKDY